MFFLEALMISLIISAIIGVINIVVRTDHSGSVLTINVVGFLLSTIITTLLNWAVLWWIMPTETGTLWGKAWWLFPILVSGAIYFLADMANDDDNRQVGVGSVIAIVGAILLTLFALFNTWTIRSEGGANHVASLITVTREEPDTYPDTDVNHLVQVPEETALYKASQYVAKEKFSAPDGKTINLSTVYKLGSPGMQMVQGHLYYIFPLNFGGYRNWKQVDKTVVGYIVIDAENPDSQPIAKLGYSMKYVPSAWFGNKLERQLYDRGYDEYIVDSLILEVDDDWNPFYTAAINQRTLHNGAAVPQAMVVINPQTGEITEHGLDEVPEWVDRIYSKELAEQLVNWYSCSLRV